MTVNPVWNRMLYTCTHMATVGVKGLKNLVKWTPYVRSRGLFVGR